MREAAVQVTYKYVVEDVDRHGNVRLYVRRPGYPKVRLHETPGTEAFTAAYHTAMAGKARSPAFAKGTFGALCLAYYASLTFKKLDASTRAWRRRALNRLCVTDGHKPVSLLRSHHLEERRDDLVETPGAARNLVKATKALFKWAVKSGEASSNPARDVEVLKYVSTGHHPWSIEDVEQYEATHPIGTKARLAMALLLHTAGRREDATRLGRQHARRERLRFTQAKNEHRNPIHIDLPFPRRLARIIDATPTGDLTFLVTDYGKPFTPAGFGNKMRQWCDEAGLPECSAHGLRHAAATRLAEAGATAHEIMSVTGHQTLAEVERYTKAARQAGLADRAFAKVESGTGSPTHKTSGTKQRKIS